MEEEEEEEEEEKEDTKEKEKRRRKTERKIFDVLAMPKQLTVTDSTRNSEDTESCLPNGDSISWSPE